MVVPPCKQEGRLAGITPKFAARYPNHYSRMEEDVPWEAAGGGFGVARTNLAGTLSRHHSRTFAGSPLSALRRNWIWLRPAEDGAINPYPGGVVLHTSGPFRSSRVAEVPGRGSNHHQS